MIVLLGFWKELCHLSRLQVTFAGEIRFWKVDCRVGKQGFLSTRLHLPTKDLRVEGSGRRECPSGNIRWINQMSGRTAKPKGRLHED